MREIKFRVWDKDKKKFIVDDNWLDDDGYLTKFSFQTLQQFTGLKDKNGKEIYEGDIVKAETLYNKCKIKHIGEIKFESATFIFGCDDVTDSYMTFIELFGDWDTEVIGNIYENPELLK